MQQRRWHPSPTPPLCCSGDAGPLRQGPSRKAAADEGGASAAKEGCGSLVKRKPSARAAPVRGRALLTRFAGPSEQAPAARGAVIGHGRLVHQLVGGVHALQVVGW